MKILLWRIRNKKEITLKKLSEMTGISKTRLNYIENEKRDVKIKQLEKIAKALDVRRKGAYGMGFF